MLAQIAPLFSVLGVKFDINFHLWVAEVQRLALHRTKLQITFQNLPVTNKKIYQICGTKVNVIEL